MSLRLVVEWLVVFAGLTAIGAPIAALLFPRLPGRGAAFALPAALLPLALSVFWFGHLSFGFWTVVAGLLAVMTLAGASYVLGGVPRWRAVGSGFAVFAVGFLALLSVRVFDPGITPAGGEQFLHFGLVNALLRADALPPEDFWFAGEPLRYYYGSQLQVTTFTMLAGTEPRYGFNLGVATFYGLLFVVAYGLVGSVLALGGRSYRLGGALGAFFVAVGGSLTTGVRIAFGLLPRDLALQYGGPAFGAIRHLPYEEAVLAQSDPTEWFWFYTRYVVPDTLQEFPLYSFVKADLHGHALANGYVLFAAAIALSYYLTPAGQRRRRIGLVFGGMGVVAGVFGFMNTWSLPTVVGLAWLVLAAADPHPATLFPDRVADRLAVPGLAGGGGPLPTRLAGELWRLLLSGVLASLVGLIGVLLASPFLVFGHVPTNEGIGLFPPRTDLAPFVVVYGGLLALFVGYLAAEGYPAIRRYPAGLKVGGALLGAVAVVGTTTVLDFPVLAITGPILLAAWLLVRTGRLGFEGVLLVAGVGLVLSMDVVYARVWPPTHVRWNTTLKVAVQGWTLAGAAAGVASARLLSDNASTFAALLSRASPVRPPSGLPRPDRPRRSAATTVLAVLLVVAVVATSAAFPVLVAATEVGAPLVDPDADPTVDGLAVHDRSKPGEMAAIYWLDDRGGTPTVVEAPGRDTYQWTNPASALTGVPTVVGWDHQRGYRGSDAFERRAAAVDAVYVGPWADAARVLRRYDVRYVYVGPNERQTYGDVRAFDRDAFSVAFRNDAVTIYAVDRSALPEPA